MLYTEAAATIQRITEESNVVRQRLEQSRKMLDVAKTKLSEMQAEYSGFITDLETDVTNKNEPLWDRLGEEKDALVSDFSRLTQVADDLIAAFDSVV